MSLKTTIEREYLDHARKYFSPSFMIKYGTELNRIASTLPKGKIDAIFDLLPQQYMERHSESLVFLAETLSDEVALAYAVLNYQFEEDFVEETAELVKDFPDLAVSILLQYDQESFSLVKDNHDFFESLKNIEKIRAQGIIEYTTLEILKEGGLNKKVEDYGAFWYDILRSYGGQALNVERENSNFFKNMKGLINSYFLDKVPLGLIRDLTGAQVNLLRVVALAYDSNRLADFLHDLEDNLKYNHWDETVSLILKYGLGNVVALHRSFGESMIDLEEEHQDYLIWLKGRTGKDDAITANFFSKLPLGLMSKEAVAFKNYYRLHGEGFQHLVRDLGEETLNFLREHSKLLDEVERRFGITHVHRYLGPYGETTPLEEMLSPPERRGIYRNGLMILSKHDWNNAFSRHKISLIRDRLYNHYNLLIGEAATLKELDLLLDLVPNSSLDFFCLGGHGQPYELKLSPKAKITSDDDKIFNRIGKKMSLSSTIFIYSCSTAQEPDGLAAKIQDCIPYAKIFALSKSGNIEDIICGEDGRIEKILFDYMGS